MVEAQPIEVRQTPHFARWFRSLRDFRAQDRIAIRIRRIGMGNPGDVKTVGGGVSEARIPYGPGYRLYFIQRGTELVILLCGGDKSSQAKDIDQAKILSKEIENGD